MGQISFSRIVLSFLISTLLFISIFIISNWIIISEYQRNTELQQRIEQKIYFIDSNAIQNCTDYLTTASIELDNAGSILGILEDRLGKNNPIVISQKENYSRLELKHFFSIKNYMKRCNKNITTILFFYSNKKEYTEDAEIKGYILSKIKRDDPERIMIYSFDYDLNTETINILKELYNIKKPNIIIINEKTILYDLKDINDIIDYINPEKF